jgi:hypothetical protein
MSVLLGVVGVINFVQLHLVSKRGRLYLAALPSRKADIQSGFRRYD